jgi:hypothetical protein
MTGAQLLALHRCSHPGGKMGVDKLGTVADDHHHAHRLEWSHRLQDPRDQRSARSHVGHLGPVGDHPLALPSG